MATTYKKLDSSMPVPDGTSDDDKWKYNLVEKICDSESIEKFNDLCRMQSSVR